MKDYLRLPVAGKSDSLDSLLPKATELFKIGLGCLKAISSKDYELHFSEWARMVKEATGDARELTIPQLEWLWGAIASEPLINEALGDRIVSLEIEWKKVGPIECAPGGSRFGIFLRGFRGEMIPYNSCGTERYPKHTPKYGVRFL